MENASTTDIAKALGIAVRTVRHLIQRGHLPPAGPLQAYIDAHRAYKRTADAPKAASRQSRTGERQARQRLLEAQAEREELRLARDRGELMPVADALRFVETLVTETRNVLLAVPSRAAARLGHLQRADLAVFDDEIRLALAGLSEKATPDALAT